MYIEYVILYRDMLLSEEFMYEPVWCAYELKDLGNNIAIGVCGKVPDKYKDQAMSFGEVMDLLYKPFKEVSLKEKRALWKPRKEKDESNNS